MQGMGSDFFRPTGREKLLTMRKHARHAYVAGSNPPQNNYFNHRKKCCVGSCTGMQ